MLFVSFADFLLRASLEHVQARPQPIFSLARACADRVQSGMNMRGQAGPGGENISELKSSIWWECLPLVKVFGTQLQRVGSSTCEMALQVESLGPIMFSVSNWRYTRNSDNTQYQFVTAQSSTWILNTNKKLDQHLNWISIRPMGHHRSSKKNPQLKA